MRIPDEKLRDEILVLRPHAGATLAAAFLRAIGRKRRALHIAGMRDGDDHLFLGDEIFVFDLASATRIRTGETGDTAL